MKKFIKENWKFILFVALIGAIGGIFTGLYTFESMPKDALKQAIDMIGSKEILIVITVMQCMMYGVVCAILGIILCKKIGLWKKFTFEKKPVLSAIIVSIIDGVILILFDIFLFNNYSEVIANSYNNKPTLSYFISSITYGGIIEEVMMRLFLMSLISFIIYKVFYKNSDGVPQKAFIIANILTAVLFAVGHLPATSILIGLNAITVLRCFLLNGVVALLFGRLYRKYGIQYAMFAHIGCHIVSKVIWILFI